MLSFILFTSPILLLIISGMLIRVRGDPETAGRRYFLFLIWTGIAFVTIILIRQWLYPEGGFLVAVPLAPVTAGIITLIFLNIHEWRTLRRAEKAVAFALLVFFVGLAVISLWTDVRDRSWMYGLDYSISSILSVSAIMSVAWAFGKRFPILLGIFILICLMMLNVSGMGALAIPLGEAPTPAFVSGMVLYLALPVLVLAGTVLLILAMLNLRPASWHRIVGYLGLSLLLLGGFIYTFIWVWIWDGTDDGIRGYLLLTASSMIAVTITMVIGMDSVGWRRWLGVPVAILIIGSMYGSVILFASGERSPHHLVTESRAEHIREALESYRAKNGSYPTSLDELVPGELWRIPEPMILLGDQEWCYEGSPDYYRLGTLYRYYWSDPYLEVRVYASAGNVPEMSWVCDVKLAELRSRYEYYGPPPTPVPLPTSVTSVERIRIDPFYKARSFSVGSWSPDGAYLVFGSTEYFMDEVEHVTIDLRFLDARTGDICQPEPGMWTVQKSNGLRDHHAWLPDGRFLYLTDEGEMPAFEPCTGGMENLADRFPVSFTHALTFDAESGRVLLKNQEGYWLLDGSRLEVQPVAGVPVVAEDGSWTWFAWSQGGTRLAISMLMGTEGSDGGFLYIVDGESGDVMHSLPLPDASDAYLPIVEWLTRDSLLVHGNSLTVLDLRSDPPARTDLLRDVFLLDMEYPLDVSSVDSMPGAAGDGYLIGLRANHPNNQGLYLYNSSSGQVTVFDHNTHSLFFAGDGRCLRLSKWEDEPSYRDVYEMVWLDRPTVEHLLVVEGHTPRSYPQMFPRCLPHTSRLLFSSSQGISLVSLPDGRTIRFWELAGEAVWNDVFPSPSEETLVIAADQDGLYYIPLPPE